MGLNTLFQHHFLRCGFPHDLQSIPVFDLLHWLYLLFQINQDVFYELMEGNADIMKQIIRLLTSRIREANSKLE